MIFDKITKHANQNLLDVALIGNGSIESIFEIALENDLAITDTIENGTVLNVKINPLELRVLKHYNRNDIIPATASFPEWFSIGCSNAILQETGFELLQENGNCLQLE